MIVDPKCAKATWKTGVICYTCEDDIIAYPTLIEEKHVEYGFTCRTCKISGRWEELARGYFESREYYDQSPQETKKIPGTF